MKLFEIAYLRSDGSVNFCRIIARTCWSALNAFKREYRYRSFNKIESISEVA